MTDELDPQLKQLLDELKPVPPRNPQQAAHGRARFLSKSAQPVSGNTFLSLIDQIPIFRKERFSMNTIFVITLVFAALFGGAAGTAYAAQNDLPTEALYPVKTLTEDARLALASNPQVRLDLLANLAQIRTQEMVQLAEAGIVPPEATLSRLQEHTRMAFNLAASLPEADMLRTMEQLRSRLHTQLQLIDECAAIGDPLRTMIQTRLMLQEHLRLLDDGLADPQGFRNAVQHGLPIQQPGGFGPGGQPEATPASGGSYGPGEQPETIPGQDSGYGPGSPPESTPVEGGGYGPGNPPDVTPAQSGDNGFGNPPEATPNPGNGSGSNPTQSLENGSEQGGGGNRP